MNASLPPDAVAVASLPVAEIIPSSSNPRKRFDNAYLAELAESIKAHGLIQPITVRPLPLDALFEYNKRRKQEDDSLPPRYEIVVGECRWRAAQLAGLIEIPGFWRELDDKQVLEIQVIENLQRRDVHPIEEAEGYQTLMQRHGYTADEIAAKIGKSKGYVYARLKLTALHPEAREAFFSGQLDASTALLIARIPGAALQKKAVAKIINGYNGEPLSYRSAVFEIRNNFTISLKEATFPPDDAVLVPTAGSCSDCPKRSGNCPEICTDLKDADVCTDTQCFDDKRLARRAQLVAQAEKLKIPVVTGSEAWQEYRDDKRLDPDDAVEGDGQGRTYRDILGDALPKPAALVEIGHGTRERLVELVDATAMAKALQKAGWTPDLFKDKAGERTAPPDPAELQRRQEERQREDEEHAQREEDANTETARRTEALQAVTGRLHAMTLDTDHVTERLLYLLAEAWFRQVIDCNELDDLADGIRAHLDADYALPDEFDEAPETDRAIDILRAAPLGRVVAFLLDDMVRAYETPVRSFHLTDGAIEKNAPFVLAQLSHLLEVPFLSVTHPAFTPTQAAQAQGEGSTEPAAPAKPKGKKAAAKKTGGKTDPAPALPANEPAAPVETQCIGNWPFPTVAEAA